MMKQIIITFSSLVLAFCTPTSAQTLPPLPAGNATNIGLIPKPINFNTPPLDQVPHTREVIIGSNDPDSEDAIRTIVPVVQVGNGTTYPAGATHGKTYPAGGFSLGNRVMVASLTSPTYWDKAFGNWGKWVGPVYCPPGHWAVGAQLRVEHEQYVDHWLKNSVGDDTAMNAFRLLCAPLGTFGQTYQTVEPHAGYWGTWRDAIYCERSLVVGFELRTERADGHQKTRDAKAVWDRVAATGLRILCSNNVAIDLPGGMHWGEWTSQMKCPKGSAVCGAYAQVEGPQSGREKDVNEDRTDNTALNNIAMDCCKVELTTCTPTDKWETIWEVDNQLDWAVDRDYTKTTGVTRTDDKEKSGSQEDEWRRELVGEGGLDFEGLSVKFSRTLGTSATTRTDWRETSSLSFTESTTESMSHKVPAKTCMKMRQVVGECGASIVRTNRIHLVNC